MPSGDKDGLGVSASWGSEIPSCAGQGHVDCGTKMCNVQDRANAGVIGDCEPLPTILAGRTMT